VEWAAKIAKLPVLLLMACHTIPDVVDMKTNSKTWLQLYVDAMTEKDPYKRLALVQELRKIPRHDDSEEQEPPKPLIRPVKSIRPVKGSKLVRRH
jgi:hypothetical protein